MNFLKQIVRARTVENILVDRKWLISSVSCFADYRQSCCCWCTTDEEVEEECEEEGEEEETEAEETEEEEEEEEEEEVCEEEEEEQEEEDEERVERYPIIASAARVWRYRNLIITLLHYITNWIAQFFCWFSVFGLCFVTENVTYLPK